MGTTKPPLPRPLGLWGGALSFLFNRKSIYEKRQSIYENQKRAYYVMVKDFDSLLAMLRRKRRITQKELAEALGVTDTTVRNWETGRSVPQLTPRQYKKLAEVLGISLEEIPDDFGPQPVHDTGDRPSAKP